MPLGQEIGLKIGGLRVGLSWGEANLLEEPILKFYRPFHLEGPPDLSLEVQCGPLPTYDLPEPLFDASRNRWRLFQEDGHYLFQILDSRPPHPERVIARIDRGLTAGQVFLLPEEATHPRGWSLSRLMRPLGELLLIQHLAGEGRGVMVHALGVEVGGRGFLFFGRSGAGKTTLADYLKPERGVTVLGDERIVVTRREGRFFIEGTPWPGGGFHVSPGPALLHRAFLLSHGLKNEVVDEGNSRLALPFLEQVFTAPWSDRLIASTLEFVGSLAQAIPMSRLAFKNSPEVVAFLRERVFRDLTPSSPPLLDQGEGDRGRGLNDRGVT